MEGLVQNVAPWGDTSPQEVEHNKALGPYIIITGYATISK